MTEQPTGPTAVRDFVMACAWKATQSWHAHLNNECEDHFGRPCPATRAADERTQQAVEWAMARARVGQLKAEAHRHWHAPCEECEAVWPVLDALEADAAEKWEAMQ